MSSNVPRLGPSGSGPQFDLDFLRSGMARLKGHLIRVKEKADSKL